MRSFVHVSAAVPLYPGVRRAGVLLGPVGRPPCGGIEVHVVGGGGGFEAEWLRRVVGRGVAHGAGRLLHVAVLVAVRRVRQVHALVRLVVTPARLLSAVVLWLWETE